jgi:hypothetical protein
MTIIYYKRLAKFQGFRIRKSCIPRFFPPTLQFIILLKDAETIFTIPDRVPPFKSKPGGCMKTTKILLWDEVGEDGAFICVPYHPEVKETAVFHLQPKEAPGAAHLRGADAGEHFYSEWLKIA